MSMSLPSARARRVPSLSILGLGLGLFALGCGQPLPDEGEADESEGIIAEELPGDGAISAMAHTQVEARVLQLINQARATARTCGTTSYAKAPPLATDERLVRAAQLHSKDMATKNYFSHTGLDGSRPWDRVSRQGYAWSAVGENIAAGYTTPEAVVQGWLKSAGHCANIMNPRYTQTGVGQATGGRYGVYWTQVFARPR
jgi:uncharacterized protein YkwD